MKKNKGHKNIDIFEKYFHVILGAKNKFGAFESICGTKRSFSIYMPYVLEMSLECDVNLLVDRKILKEYIARHLENMNDIGEQNYKGSIKSNRSVFTKLYSLTRFIIRGNGTSNLDEKHFKACKKLLYNDMKCNLDGWFYSLFDIEDILSEIFNFDNPRVATRLWKLKRVLDVIEKRNYSEYLIRE